MIMGEYWLRALRAAEAAEEAARRLRRRYGQDAEAHITEATKGLPGESLRDTRPEDVRRALRWT